MYKTYSLERKNPEILFSSDVVICHLAWFLSEYKIICSVLCERWSSSWSANFMVAWKPQYIQLCVNTFLLHHGVVFVFLPSLQLRMLSVQCTSLPRNSLGILCGFNISSHNWSLIAQDIVLTHLLLNKRLLQFFGGVDAICQVTGFCFTWISEGKACPSFLT